jgi:hypothetical protein
VEKQRRIERKRGETETDRKKNVEKKRQTERKSDAVYKTAVQNRKKMRK